ncbi:MAG: TIGR00289 family protein [Thermoplasmata archaeon]|nr:TIGR00289 family protein [Thermoplasmata archaeon]
MRVACLISGGKDSLYACYVAMHYGWSIDALIAVKPKKISWMFHYENISLVPLIAETMGKKLLMKESEAEKENELEDLKELIQKAGVDGVISGAIASEYQRTRIEKICHEIGVKSFTPLWHKRQEDLLQDLIKAGFEVIITAVAAEGFGKDWLGRKIDEKCIEELLEIGKKYGINVAGEGGEFETLVIDCPLYRKKLRIIEAERKWDGSRGTYEVRKAELIEKDACKKF